MLNAQLEKCMEEIKRQNARVEYRRSNPDSERLEAAERRKVARRARAELHRKQERAREI